MAPPAAHFLVGPVVSWLFAFHQNGLVPGRSDRRAGTGVFRGRLPGRVCVCAERGSCAPLPAGFIRPSSPQSPPQRPAVARWQLPHNRPAGRAEAAWPISRAAAAPRPSRGSAGPHTPVTAGGGWGAAQQPAGVPIRLGHSPAPTGFCFHSWAARCPEIKGAAGPCCRHCGGTVGHRVVPAARSPCGSQRLLHGCCRLGTPDWGSEAREWGSRLKNKTKWGSQAFPTLQVCADAPAPQHGHPVSSTPGWGRAVLGGQLPGAQVASSCSEKPGASGEGPSLPHLLLPPPPPQLAGCGSRVWSRWGGVG